MLNVVLQKIVSPLKLEITCEKNALKLFKNYIQSMGPFEIRRKDFPVSPNCVGLLFCCTPISSDHGLWRTNEIYDNIVSTFPLLSVSLFSLNSVPCYK